MNVNFPRFPSIKIKSKTVIGAGQNLLSGLLLIVMAVSAANGQETPPSADSASAKRNGYFGLPALYYTPETKIAAGAVLGYFYREAKSSSASRPSTFISTLIYTQRKLVRFRLGASSDCGCFGNPFARKGAWLSGIAPGS